MISYYGKNMSPTLTLLFISLPYRKGSGQPEVKGRCAQTLLLLPHSYTQKSTQGYVLTHRDSWIPQAHTDSSVVKAEQHTAL